MTTTTTFLLSAQSEHCSLSQYWKKWIKALLLAAVRTILGRNTNVMHKDSWEKIHISQQDFYNCSREFEKVHSEKNSPFFIIFILVHVLLDIWNENSDLELWVFQISVLIWLKDMTESFIESKGCLFLFISSVRIEEVLVRVTLIKVVNIDTE